MTERKADGIPIPDVIDPPESMRVTLCVPKNRDHLSAFFGALYELTYWNRWQSDEAHSGRLLADVWWRYYLSWDRNMSDERCDEMACCETQVVLHRINPDTGRPEISTDGGTTWTSDPNDAQNLITLYPPLVGTGSDHTRCDAATNASEHINELISETHNNLSTAATIFDLAVGVAEAILALFLILASAGTLTPAVTTVATAIWGAAAGAFALGIAGFDAYWTTDRKDAILCALYCTVGSNGQFTEAQYQNFRAKVKSTLPASPAFDIVMTAINSGGATGLSQMASYGNAAEADCSSCTCVGCDITTWIRQSYLGNPVGNITARGTDWIEIEGTPVPGLNPFNDACVVSPADGACCRVLSVTDVSGGTLAMPVLFAVNCGNPRWPNSSTGGLPLPSADFVNTVFLRGDNGQFHVRVTFTAEP